MNNGMHSVLLLLRAFPGLRKHAFSTLSCRAKDAPLPPRRKIADSEITESFLKGSGPGGQKINKTSSAVQLKHLPTGIVVKSQETRSREQNRKLARQILGERLDARENGAGSRAAVKAERERRRKSSGEKKRRRKYRRLEAAKAAEGGGSGTAGGQGQGGESDAGGVK